MVFKRRIVFYVLITLGAIMSCDNSDNEESVAGVLQLTNVTTDGSALDLNNQAKNTGISISASFEVSFSASLDQSSINNVSIQKQSGQTIPLEVSISNEKTLIAKPIDDLDPDQTYQLNIPATVKGINGEKFPGITISFTTKLHNLELISVIIDGTDATGNQRITNISITEGTTIDLHFSKPLSTESIHDSRFFISGGGAPVPISVTTTDDPGHVQIVILSELRDLTRYFLTIVDNVKGENGEPFEGFSRAFYTTTSDTPDFPIISDADLLTLVQRQTFKYFYEFAHPQSGMARERNSSGDIVTTGGTGFGIMSLIVGIERNFITREEGLTHFNKILTFLEQADRFHGVWPHWLNGNTGKVVPFSADDNGGDLVETSFLVQGLLTFRQFLNSEDAEEQVLVERINTLWKEVEWDWYTREGQNVLYWHWSPDRGWAMNHQIKGYNEALITYVLAAASPTHTINEEVYHQGWASNGGILNGKQFYNITLPLGFDYGGPLFFAHYSFLGLDPRNLSDEYGNYWAQNVNHSRINQAHAIANPKKFVGYSEQNWGFTASDNHKGYSAHSPTNDLGVITPTAALSSMPYTPEESMDALRFFYYSVGDRLWGDYGFYDAFNITENWFANSYLAIDQGPIVVMIENYRTGLLWDLFMSAPEVQTGLDKLGFTY